jgi:hypothetical protein
MSARFAGRKENRRLKPASLFARRHRRDLQYAVRGRSEDRQRRLGHSKVGITLDFYSHVLPNMEADAVAQVDDALRAAINKRTRDVE